VGWRDRDWAKFSDDEWQAIYGFRRKAPRETPRDDVPILVSGRRNRLRRYVWGGLALLAIVVLAGGFALRASDGRTAQRLASPPVLYGLRGSGGTNTVCTEMAVAQGSTSWRCLAWTVNVNHAAIVEPRPYTGPCTHAVVDQARGAWTCLGVVGPGAAESGAPSS
jgi:hypothetical protein